MREIFYGMCDVLKKQGAENPESHFRETAEDEKQKLIDLIGTEVSEFIAFYTQYQPVDIVTFRNADISLKSIRRIVDEAEDLPPCCYLKEFGIYAFAATTGGNVLAIDTNDVENGDPRVLVIDHNFLYEDYDEPEKLMIDVGFVSKESEETFEDNWEATIENVRRGAIELEGSFVSFLHKLSHDEYDDVEKYMDGQVAWHA